MVRRIAVSVLVALALLGLLRRFAPLRRSPAPPERVALWPWDLTGCYRLDVGAWDFRPGTDTDDERASASPPSSGDRASPPGAMPGASGAEGGSLLSPPDVLALVADSTDEWRRPLTTYRALPTDSASRERLRGLLRWFVRADTLWIVWSDRSTQVGLALFAAGEGFVGGARSSRYRYL